MTPQEWWLLILFIALLMGIMSGVQVMLAIAGVPILVAVVASFTGHFDLSYLGAYPLRIFGVMDNTLLIAVPLFILMGILLERSKVAERMLLAMADFFGGSRSGLAYSVLLVSALIAASTGIIGATIVMLGMISLPAMLRAGVSLRLSSGLICASGTLGQIIPPSIVLILLGDQISNAYLEAQRNVGNFAPDPVSVGDLFAGVLIPGLMLVALYALYIFIHGYFNKEASSVNTKAIKPLEAQSPQALDTSQVDKNTSMLRVFLPPMLLIVAVLGSILLGVATPTEAAAVGVAGTLLIAAGTDLEKNKWLKTVIVLGAISAFALVILKAIGLSVIDYSSGSIVLNTGSVLALSFSFVLLLSLLLCLYQLLKMNILIGALQQTVSISAMVFGIILAASMLSLVFRGFGGDEVVEQLLSGIPGDKWGALFAVMLVIFLLGFVLEFIEIVFIVIPIVGPVLLATDFHPVWLAVLIALNLQTSFLTPPFGFALFYFRSVAPKSIRTSDIYYSVIPFVIIQLIAMLLLVAFPNLATWLPSIIFN